MLRVLGRRLIQPRRIAQAPAAGPLRRRQPQRARGVTLIDTAPVYGFGRSEEIVGKALAEGGLLSEPGGRT